MKKWVYLSLGLLLIANGIVAQFVVHFPTSLFQGLWGLVGIWLLYKANRRFRERA